MDWNTVERNWPAFVAPIMQRWPEAEEADLLALDGERDRFEAYLAGLPGMDAPLARDAVARWLEGEVPADVVMDEERDDANITASAAHIPVGEDVYSEDRDFGDDGQADSPMGRSD